MEIIYKDFKIRIDYKALSIIIIYLIFNWILKVNLIKR